MLKRRSFLSEAGSVRVVSRPRALISVFDKTGVVDFAKGLADLGWDLVSSGGTARVLSDAGLDVVDVADYTGSPIMLGHRVVTLHPRIHGGILADRDEPEHLADLEANDIAPIDLVVGNLYPFVSEPGIEMIDVGGPTMVRAAAKNHAHVGVMVDPADYGGVLDELRNDGALSAMTRRRLARAAFAHTAAYDAAIVSWLDEVPHGASDEESDDGADEQNEGAGEALPQTIHLALEKAQTLRYGENPHQAGARYRPMDQPSQWDQLIQHNGLALSYLNLFDAEAAWCLVHDLGDDPAVAIIKHANPCGVAVAEKLHIAYTKAFECDPRSAFGGIVACNTVVDEVTVEAMEDAAQADVVIAPGYAAGVVERLKTKRENTRVLEMASPPMAPTLALRQIGGDYLVQEGRHFASSRESWQVVSKRWPSDDEFTDAEFAWRVCGHVNSNAIVLAKNNVAWGIGAGQQNRVESSEIAARKAAGRAVGGACASDAFYPFPDGIHTAADAGVAVIIQPGGSVNDADTITAADDRDTAMIFTGERQFLH